jgi:hypothetical protein
MPTQQGIDERRKRRVANRLVLAIHQILEAAEELKKANDAFSREASRQLVKVADVSEGGENGEE